MPIQGRMGQLRGDQASITTYVEQLRRRLAEKVDRARRGLPDTPSMPNSTFDLEDPMLEAALTDATMRFFLEHMTVFDNLSGAVEADVEPRHEAVPDEELQATLDRVAAFDSIEQPDLHSNLEVERFWIVADLLSTGDALSQHLATVEIRGVMTQARSGDLPLPTARLLLDRLLEMPDRPLLLDLLYKILAEQLNESPTGICR